MKRLFLSIFVIVGLIYLTAPVHAIPLLQEDFSSATIATGSINDPSDIVAHKWYDFPNTPRWTIFNDSGDNIAKLTPTDGDVTNILFTAVDATGLSIGTELTLDFEYKYTEPTTPGRAFAYLVGLNFPGNDLDTFAPWLDDAAGGGGSPDVNDGTVLYRLDLAMGGAGWISPTFPSVILSQEFDAIGVAFVFGDGRAFMGVDDVSLEASAASVPEPSTMLLFGSGLIGLWGFRKKFKK